jgi:CHAD domain-containing protein
LCLSVLTKSLRGERALGGQGTSAVHAPALVLPAPADGSALWRQVLRSVLDQVLAHAGAVAEGQVDAELVHQLRVGLRRLRTALRELAALGPAIDPAWTAALGEAFARLGDYRDEESMARVVRPLLQAAALKVPHRDPPDPAQVSLAVRAPAFQAALVALLGLAHAQHAPSAGLTAGATRRHLAARLERLHRRVVDSGRRFRHLTLARQHRVRKQLKRLRYLAEFVRPLWPARAVARYLGPLQPAQDALGAYNDLAVAAQRFAQQARGDAHAAAAAQFLQGQLAPSARRGQRALRAVGRAPRFWG